VGNPPPGGVKPERVSRLYADALSSTRRFRTLNREALVTEFDLNISAQRDIRVLVRIVANRVTS